MKKVFCFILILSIIFCFGCSENKSLGKTQKIVYLTFDDGPCYNTLKIIDKLNKYNVKATFFVVGTMVEKHPFILEKIYQQNHRIGLHSYSHKYKEIFTSSYTLKQDITLCYNAIKKVLPNFNGAIYRFPGGSYGLTEEKLKTVKSLGLTFYDWNASSLDCEKAYTPYEIFNNVKSTSFNKDNIILLCHDTKFNTYLALDDIILYYLKNGYIFKTL